ncbi:glycosyltransferase family 2 protein [Agrococcus sp. ARC_14]|uniref:glycosyltransferase family 2 protein n=1 Tax=Agrococcus sp. ARC_14 TaxID=2919927 RepID=UPI001F051CEB|nr:glycosyltransferase family 2 protein [Agrococcus sp. ARC_14]MCH1882344.1 glycosyltransferase family 2 protein [Agrococcus sp. ARC_14]
MMVRDEADVIAATIEHHLAEGVDRILVTDNASVDGTREILADYARAAPVTVFDDPEHRKQQAEVVTRMARLAATEHAADWVINGDADEFVLAGERTVAEALALAPATLGSFPVPVRNLVGPTARSGAGLATRMHWRDERSAQQLAAAGVQAHPTPNAIHVGDPHVEVAQGNHAVSTPQRGAVPDALGLEVLHVPWRSWEQFERKTISMGRGYEASPSLDPSPNHHGMRDWRRWKAGILLPFYLARTPVDEADFGEGFVRDDRLATRLAALEAVLPARLAEAVDPARDAPFDPEEVRALLSRERDLHALDEAFHAEVATEIARRQALERRAITPERLVRGAKRVVRGAGARIRRIRR